MVPGRGDALVIVDAQVDFCPGGALPIPDGDQVVPVLNKWIHEAEEKSVPVYASRDWHPREHISFQDNGGPWPPHCIQDSKGASFHPDLELPPSVIKVTKGVRFDQDQNSAFDQTGLSRHMKSKGIKRLFVGGLAEDVCVLSTVIDAVKAGFLVVLLSDATFPVDVEGGRAAREEMKSNGVVFV